MRLNFDSIIFLDTHLGSRFYSYITFLLQFLGSSRQIIACCFTNIRAKSFEKDLILNNLRNNYPPSPSITTIHIETFQKNLSSTNSSTISTRKTIFPIFQLPRAITFAFSVLHPSHACKKRENLSQATWPRPDHDHPYPSIHLSIHSWGRRVILLWKCMQNRREDDRYDLVDIVNRVFPFDPCTTTTPLRGGCTLV